MKQTLIDLISSKKFLAAVTATAVYVGGRLGLRVDEQLLDHVYWALLAYVGAQGVADAGKSAAIIAKVEKTS
jgi:NAD(P)H-dependent FMN reductase